MSSRRRALLPFHSMCYGNRYEWRNTKKTNRIWEGKKKTNISIYLWGRVSRRLHLPPPPSLLAAADKGNDDADDDKRSIFGRCAYNVKGWAAVRCFAHITCQTNKNSRAHVRCAKQFCIQHVIFSPFSHIIAHLSAWIGSELLTVSVFYPRKNNFKLLLHLPLRRCVAVAAGW